jgi:hypothetical protein
MNTTTIKVPQAFWADHKDRDCVQGPYEIKVLSKHYVLTLSDHDLCELWSDAYHYKMSSGDFGWEMQWLVSSARATCNAIAKQVGLEVVAAKWLELEWSANSGRMSGLPIAREVQ